MVFRAQENHPRCGTKCSVWRKQRNELRGYHNGLNDARVFLDENGCRKESSVKKKDLENAIETTTADVLVLDGVNRDSYNEALEQLIFWRKAGTNRAGFLTISNKIEELHPHELENMQEKGLYNYFSEHSWILGEYLAMFVNKDGSASPLFQDNVDVFRKEWEIPGDNQAARKRDRTGNLKLASITEIITQKYFFVGGSARWMVRLTTSEAQDEIDKSIAEAKLVGDILDFNLGPKSPAAKTHLYGSMADNGGITRYSIVSERATQMLVNVYGQNGIKELYAHATNINNPAFLGWVIEADFFSRCARDNLSLCKKGNPSADAIDFEKPVEEFDCDELLGLSEADTKEGFLKMMKRLLPSDESKPKVCKPRAWNQGGYDVVRIVKGPNITVEKAVKQSYHLLFGQVTKSASHALKLRYFFDFAKCMNAADFVVASIEIGFIVPPGTTNKFRISAAKVTGSGRLCHFDVHDASPPAKAIARAQPNHGV